MITYTNLCRKKIINFILMFLVLILPISLSACAPPDLNSGNSNNVLTSPKEDPSQSSGEVSGSLEVHFINVGQGDSILLKQGKEYMLIDGGDSGAEKTLKSYFTSLGIKSFKYVIGTHVHEDHIGSLDYVINNYSVGKVYFPSTTASTKNFENLVLAVQGKGKKFTKPTVGKSFAFGDAVCTILAPGSSKYSSGNNYSIVLKVQYGDVSFILTGDAEVESEKEILSQGFNLKSTVLKLGHHGSDTSTSDAFLKEVNPKYAVISVGVDNSYNHPSLTTMNKLKAKKIPVYRTDEGGTIIATTDGKKVTFNVRKGSYEGMHTTSQEAGSKGDTSVVYWTKSGTVYHKDKDCSALSRSTNIIKGLLKECPKDTPCSICN